MQINNIIGKNIIGDNELYPIYGLVGKPFWQTKIFYIILVSIFLLAFLFLTVFLIKKFKKVLPKQQYWQISLSELSELKSMLLQDKISHKNFYLILTDIIKKYLFNRFGYDLFGLTDQELVKFLESKEFDKNLLENVKSMFLSMEVIKFANESTVKGLMEKDLLRCTDLVNKTIDKKQK
jgi:hypothetical protein